MVTASHNPSRFNGIKCRVYPGCSIESKIAKKIESYIGKNKVKSTDIKQAKNKGKIKIVNILDGYKKNIKKFLNWAILKESNASIAVDSMHGAADNIISDILKNTKIKVNTIRSKPRVDFGNDNPEPISQNISKLRRVVSRGNFDIGIALDGDGDRLGCIGLDGKFINSSQIAGLLIQYLIKYKNKKGIIAKTISCSSLIDRIAEKYNLKLIETPIGFKYLSKEMIKKDVLIAIEESGGIGVKDYIYDRDAIMMSMLLLEALTVSRKNITVLLKSMEKEFGRFHYQRIDLEFAKNRRKDLVHKLKDKSFKSILKKKVKNIKKIDGIKFILDDESWLMYRFSGTEPVLRLYAESYKEQQTLDLLNFAKKSIKNI